MLYGVGEPDGTGEFIVGLSSVGKLIPSSEGSWLQA
jgi:hypothetical protein